MTRLPSEYADLIFADIESGVVEADEFVYVDRREPDEPLCGFPAGGRRPALSVVGDPSEVV